MSASEKSYQQMNAEFKSDSSRLRFSWNKLEKPDGIPYSL